jgi:hypothetical protein
LAEAWRDGATFNELWYVPGLKVERGNWRNDPRLARQAVLNFLEQVPPAGWWPLSEMSEMIKEEEPDFQRPDGDYDSWYIRDEKTNEYLRGFERSWDKIDGALLRFILIGPMHALGLVDLSQDNKLCRLTIYGRALVDAAEWPATHSADGQTVRIMPNGLCEVTRGVNRFDRFQLSRFTEWISAAEASFTYKISPVGLDLAAGQGFKAEMMLGFLRRVSNGTLPDSVAKTIDLWGRASDAGDQPATITAEVVLRLPRPEILQVIMATPALRQYIRAPMGDSAALVLPGKHDALAAALQERGVTVNIDLAR